MIKIREWWGRFKKRITRQKPLYELAFEELGTRLRFVDQQPFTTEWDDNVSAMIAFEEMLGKLTRQVLTGAYDRLSRVIEQFGKDGVWEVDFQLTARVFPSSVLITVKSESSRGEKGVLRIAPSGDFKISDTDDVTFTFAILLLSFVLMRANRLLEKSD